MSGDRLAHLRRVAEAADHGGREWVWQHAYPQRITRVGDVVLVAECFENPDMPSRFAEFIATFDPPVALALVEIAKHAEPMANLPWPLSADERQEWIVAQNRLRDALARLDSGATEGDA